MYLDKCIFIRHETRGDLPTKGIAAPGEGVLLYFHIYVGSDHFWGFKILSFNIFLVFQKMSLFLGYEDFVNISYGSSQTGLVFGVISMHLKVFP